MRPGLRLLLLAAAMLAVLDAADAAAQPLTDEQFNRLYQDLGSERFRTREAAQRDLNRQAGMAGGLTVAQVARLQRAALGQAFEPDLEIVVRARRAYDVWARRLPSQARIFANLRVIDVPGTGDFRIGPVRGRFNRNVAAERTDFSVLRRHWLAIQHALGTGNVNDAIRGYDALNALVKRLIDNNRLNLTLNGQPLNRGTWADVTIDADGAFKNLPAELKGGGANPAPPPRQKAPVPGPGPVGLGRTFALDLAAVTIPGAVTLDLEDELDPCSLAPAGWRFAGEVFQLAGDETLRVEGEVRVTIAFGEKEETPKSETEGEKTLIDPAALAVVRIADGEAQFLDVEWIDPFAGLVQAVYVPDSADPWADPFGQFGIVVPEY